MLKISGKNMVLLSFGGCSLSNGSTSFTLFYLYR